MMLKRPCLPRLMRAFGLLGWLAWLMLTVAPVPAHAVTRLHEGSAPTMAIARGTTHGPCHDMAPSVSRSDAVPDCCRDHQGACTALGHACHCAPACTSLLPSYSHVAPAWAALPLRVARQPMQTAPTAPYSPPLRPPAH